MSEKTNPTDAERHEKIGVRVSRHTGGAYADMDEVIESELSRIAPAKANPPADAEREVPETVRRRQAIYALESAKPSVDVEAEASLTRYDLKYDENSEGDLTDAVLDEAENGEFVKYADVARALAARDAGRKPSQAELALRSFGNWYMTLGRMNPDALMQLKEIIPAQILKDMASADRGKRGSNEG